MKQLYNCDSQFTVDATLNNNTGCYIYLKLVARIAFEGALYLYVIIESESASPRCLPPPPPPPLEVMSKRGGVTAGSSVLTSCMLANMAALLVCAMASKLHPALYVYTYMGRYN